MSTSTPPKTAATPAAPAKAAPAAAPAKPAAAAAPAAPAPTEPKKAAAPASAGEPAKATKPVPAKAPAKAAASKPAAAPAPAAEAAESEDAVPEFGAPEAESDDEAGAEEGATPEALGDAPAAEAEAEADEPAAEKPIEYDFGEPPEGVAPYRAPVIEAYKAVLGKHKVDPAVAKDILDSMLPALQADSVAQHKEHVEKTTADWRAELEKRHGKKLGEVMRLANKALARGATPQLTTFFRESVLAANPDFIDMLAFFGQRVTNDRSVKGTGTPPAAKQLSPEQAIAKQYEEAGDTRGGS